MFWERVWDALEGYTVPRKGGPEGWGCLQHPPIWEVPGRGNCPEQGNLARDLASIQNMTQYLCLQCGCGPPHLLNASSGGNCPKTSSQPILQHQEGHHRSEVLWCHLCRNSGLWRCTSLIRLGTSALVSLLGFDSWVFSNPTAILGIVTYLWEKWSRLVSILYEFLILINIHIYFAKLLYQNSHSYYYISSKLCLLQVMWHVTSALTHCNDGQGIHLEMVRDNLGKYSRLEEQGFG